MTDETRRPPRDGVRAVMPGPTLDGKTLELRLAGAGEWAEIDSRTEGHFMERNVAGAFRKSFSENRNKIRIIFQHGKDPQLGNKPIADPRELSEDSLGPFARGELLDGLPELIVSGLKAGQYGTSHSFRSIREDWDPHPKGGPHNPKGLPERTIREAAINEISVVTWPAYAGAAAEVRSLSDEFALDTLTEDAGRFRDLVDYIEPIAPSADAGARPHLDTGRRDAVTDTSSPASRSTYVASEYVTPEDKAARVAELKGNLRHIGETYTGVLPTAVQAEFDAGTEELRDLNADLDAYSKRQALLATIAREERHQESTQIVDAAPTIIKEKNIYDLDRIRVESRSIDDFNTRVRENALRSIDTQRSAKDLEHLADMVENHDEGIDDSGNRSSGWLAQRVLATGSPAYKRAFAKYLNRGNTDTMTVEERAAIAVVGTTTTGGYAVPYVFDPTMYHTGVWTAENPYRKACRTVEITNGNNWRTVTVGAITSAYATESLANSENAPSFGQPTYTVQRAQAFATVSIETLEDRPDMTSELTSVFSESKDTLEENEFTLGTGATVHPFGMFRTLAYTAQATATNDVTALLDLQVVEGALPLRYRKNAAWFMNRSTLRQLMALDTTYRYFSGAGIQFAGNNQPNTFGSNGGGNTGIQCLGYPVWEVPSAVSTLTTDAAQIAVFCDPKSYIIVDRIGMNVEVVPTMLNGATPSFPTGERGIFVYWRNTAKPIAADAGRQLVVQ